MTAFERTTPAIALTRKARHRRPSLCTCCPRHILIQLSRRRSVRALAAVVMVAGIVMDLYTASRFGWIHL